MSNEVSERAASVDKVTFVKGWQAGCKRGYTLAEIADELGMKKASCSVKASQLRREGVKLLKPKGSRKSVDIASLQALADEIAAEDEDGDSDA